MFEEQPKALPGSAKLPKQSFIRETLNFFMCADITSDNKEIQKLLAKGSFKGKFKQSLVAMFNGNAMCQHKLCSASMQIPCIHANSVHPFCCAGEGTDKQTNRQTLHLID